jgi:hypothetical protein
MSGMNINPKQAAVATASAEPVTTIGAIFSNSPGMPRVFKTNFDYQLVRTMCTGAYGDGGAEGTKLCWEYVHTAIVTDKWPSSTHRPPPGTKIELPILLIGEIRYGKLVKVREYFDLLTVTEPGTPHHLYS